MNLNEYIKAIFNDSVQNFDIRDYIVDFRKYLSVYGENYGFSGNIDSFISEFNAELNGIKTIYKEEKDNYIEKLESLDKDNNNYDSLFESWYEDIIFYKIISEKLNDIYDKYIEKTKNQNDDFRIAFKKLMDQYFSSLDLKVMKIQDKVKSEIAMAKGRKLYEDRINDSIFNSVEYVVENDSFRVKDKEEFYIDRNTEDNSYKFSNKYFNTIFCKKHNDELIFTLETDMGVKQILMINDTGFAYMDNEKNIRVIFDFNTVSFVTPNSKTDYNITDEENLEKVTILLNQIDINLVDLIKNKIAIKKSNEISENAKQFH